LKAARLVAGLSEEGLLRSSRLESLLKHLFTVAS
jgi:hypothetical protein